MEPDQSNGDEHKGWRGRINGYGKPSVAVAVTMAVLYAIIQWPVNYIKDAHDAVIELKTWRIAIDKERELNAAEQRRIAGLAAERGEYIRKAEIERNDLKRGVEELNSRVSRLERR